MNGNINNSLESRVYSEVLMHRRPMFSFSSTSNGLSVDRFTGFAAAAAAASARVIKQAVCELSSTNRRVQGSKGVGEVWSICVN